MAKEKITENKTTPAPKPVKEAKSSSYIAAVGFDTADGQRFEAGDAVTGLSAEAIEGFKEMGAICDGGN